MENVNWYSVDKARMRNRERNRARLTFGIGLVIMAIGIILFGLSKSVSLWFILPSAAAMCLATYVINLASIWIDEINAGWISYATDTNKNRRKPAFVTSINPHPITRLQPILEESLGGRESA